MKDHIFGERYKNVVPVQEVLEAIINKFMGDEIVEKEKTEGFLTEHEAKVHLDDLEKLATKLYKKFRFQIGKFNFRVKFYSPQSAAQLHAFLIALNAEDMGSFAKQPEITYQMYDYLIGILTKLRDGS